MLFILLVSVGKYVHAWEKLHACHLILFRMLQFMLKFWVKCRFALRKIVFFTMAFDGVVRDALIQAVKSIKRDPLGDDVWRSFVHHFSSNPRVHDPMEYHNKSLSDFLAYAGEKSGSESDYNALETRKRGGHQREVPMVKRLKTEV